MVLKYNLSTMYAQDNPMYGAMLEVNIATSGLLIYMILAIIFIVSAYSFIRRTNDIAKSLLSSVHIVMILSVILYYMGKTTGYVLVPEVLLLSIVVVEIFGITGLYFNRMKGA